MRVCVRVFVCVRVCVCDADALGIVCKFEDPFFFFFFFRADPNSFLFLLLLLLFTQIFTLRHSHKNPMSVLPGGPALVAAVAKEERIVSMPPQDFAWVFHTSAGLPSFVGLKSSQTKELKDALSESDGKSVTDTASSNAHNNNDASCNTASDRDATNGNVAVAAVPLKQYVGLFDRWSVVDTNGVSKHLLVIRQTYTKAQAQQWMTGRTKGMMDGPEVLLLIEATPPFQRVACAWFSMVSIGVEFIVYADGNDQKNKCSPHSSLT